METTRASTSTSSSCSANRSANPARARTPTSRYSTPTPTASLTPSPTDRRIVPLLNLWTPDSAARSHRHADASARRRHDLNRRPSLQALPRHHDARSLYRAGGLSPPRQGQSCTSDLFRRCRRSSPTPRAHARPRRESRGHLAVVRRHNQHSGRRRRSRGRGRRSLRTRRDSRIVGAANARARRRT